MVNASASRADSCKGAQVRILPPALKITTFLFNEETIIQPLKQVTLTPLIRVLSLQCRRFLNTTLAMIVG